MKDNVRLSEHALVLLRAQRLKEIQMWTLIREFAQYFIFVSLVSTIIYASREENSFLQVQHLRSFLLNPRETDSDYSQVRCFSFTKIEHPPFLCL